MIIDRRSIRRLLATAFLVTVPLWLAGCLEVDATFDRDGGGTMKLTIADLDQAAHERTQKRLVSPSVKLVSAEYADKVGTYVVSFEDAQKLRTAPLFNDLRVQHSGLDSNERTLSLTLPRLPNKTSDKPDDYVMIDFTAHLPGTIVESNGTVVDDTTSSWKLTVKDMVGEGRVGARVVYTLAAPEAAGDGAKAAPQKADQAGSD